MKSIKNKKFPWWDIITLPFCLLSLVMLIFVRPIPTWALVLIVFFSVEGTYDIIKFMVKK